MMDSKKRKLDDAGFFPDPFANMEGTNAFGYQQSEMLGAPPLSNSSQFQLTGSLNLEDLGFDPKTENDFFNFLQNDITPQPPPQMSSMPSFQPQFQHQPQSVNPHMLGVPPSSTPFSPSYISSTPQTVPTTPFSPISQSSTVPSTPSSPPHSLSLPPQLYNSDTKIRAKEVEDNIKKISEGLTRIENLQKNLTLPPSRDAIKVLEDHHKTYSSSILSTFELISTLFSTVLLEPSIEYRLWSLRTELYLIAKQIDLYQQELILAKQNKIQPLARMVITKQPFPQSVMKQRMMNEIVEVQLLQGTLVHLKPTSFCRAFLVHDENVMKQNKNQIAVENDTAEMKDDRTAIFNSLKFSDGSEQKKMKIQFEMEVLATPINTLRIKTGAPTKLLVRSDLSEPLIVLTHQTQWETSEGTLFKHETFRLRSLNDQGPSTMLQEIPWALFANCLQRQFLRLTQGSRPLSLDDFAYLHSHFGNGTVVSMGDVDRFWKWFGKILYKIRHQKNLPFWVKGIIYGFMSKEDSNSILERQPSGSFIIRFSEGHPGQFAVAYRKGNEIHHYLMTEDEQKKALIDFLNERTSFEILLRVTLDAASGRSILTPIPKYSITEEFQPNSKSKKDPSDTKGYDKFIH